MLHNLACAFFPALFFLSCIIGIAHAQSSGAPVLRSFNTTAGDTVNYRLWPLAQTVSISGTELTNTSSGLSVSWDLSQFPWLSWNPTTNTLSGTTPQTILSPAQTTQTISNIPCIFTIDGQTLSAAASMAVWPSSLGDLPDIPRALPNTTFNLDLSSAVVNAEAILSVNVVPTTATQWLNVDLASRRLSGTVPSDLDYESLEIRVSAWVPSTDLTSVRNVQVPLQLPDTVSVTPSSSSLPSTTSASAIRSRPSSTSEGVRTSVTSSLVPQSSVLESEATIGSRKGISTGSIAGIIIGVGVLLIAALSILLLFCMRRRRQKELVISGPYSPAPHDAEKQKSTVHFEETAIASAQPNTTASPGHASSPPPAAAAAAAPPAAAAPTGMTKSAASESKRNISPHVVDIISHIKINSQGDLKETRDSKGNDSAHAQLKDLPAAEPITVAAFATSIQPTELGSTFKALDTSSTHTATSEEYMDDDEFEDSEMVNDSRASWESKASYVWSVRSDSQNAFSMPNSAPRPRDDFRLPAGPPANRFLGQQMSNSTGSFLSSHGIPEEEEVEDGSSLEQISRESSVPQSLANVVINTAAKQSHLYQPKQYPSRQFASTQYNSQNRLQDITYQFKNTSPSQSSKLSGSSNNSIPTYTLYTTNIPISAKDIAD